MSKATKQSSFRCGTDCFAALVIGGGHFGPDPLARNDAAVDAAFNKMYRCSATRHHCAAPIYKHSFRARLRTTLQRFNARTGLLTEL
jgi:hypothetical protein